jgi:large subunit ribosomal protein L30
MKIKLVKSLIGRKDNQIATAESMGLKKIGDVSEQPDNDATEGKYETIRHLVEKIIE